MDFTRISGQFRGFATILGKVYALPKEIVATEAFATAEKAERSDSASTWAAGKPIYPDGMAARAAFCWPTRNLLFSYPGGLWNTVRRNVFSRSVRSVSFGPWRT